MAIRSETPINLGASAGPNFAICGQGLQLARDGNDNGITAPPSPIANIPEANVVVASTGGTCAVMAFPQAFPLITPPPPAAGIYYPQYRRPWS